MDTEFIVNAEGLTGRQDLEACYTVMRVLHREFPGHPWEAGCDHETGMLYAKLGYTGADYLARHGNYSYAFRLKLATIMGPEAERRIRAAGGELLERFNLACGAATDQSRLRAAENVLDLSSLAR